MSPGRRPGHRLAEVQHGQLARVAGVVAPCGGDWFRARISERECVYCQAWGEDRRGHHLGEETHKASAFFLVQGNVRATVPLEDDALYKLHWPYRVDVPPDRLRMFAETLIPGAVAEIAWGCERVLQVGDPVLVIGDCEVHDDIGAAGGAYRQAPRQITIRGTPDRPLFISNIPWEVRRHLR